MILLIDNSNTRTKFTLGDENGLRPWQSTMATAELNPENIRAALAERHFDSVALCSVVPHAAKTIAASLGEVPLHHVSHRSELPVRIAYPHPEQIGADRLANAAAAHKKNGPPVIVIDFGTAVTFDVIDAGGAYLGGAIAPGTAVLRDYLARETALLPGIELAEPRQAIGQSTSEAMLVGSVIGYRGLIRGILDAIKKEIAGAPEIIATGGDAELISRGLPDISKVEPRLTLEGLRRIALLNITR